MEKIRLFGPRRFPAPVDRSARYGVVGPDGVTGGHRLTGVRGIAAAGHAPIGKARLDRLPDLEIVARFGVGYDKVDISAARAANLVVANTPDVPTEEAADLALGLVIATVRRIPRAETVLRDGTWRSGGFRLSRSPRGRRVGVLGLGRIATAIAERVSAMGLELAYCNRRKSPVAPHAYHAAPLALARDCDVMILARPGGPQTDGIVTRDVIHALGPDGVPANVARGRVVDAPALVEALVTGKLGAAGPDVFAAEPNLPDAPLAPDTVVPPPHVGAASTTTRDAMGDLVLANLDSWFDGNGPPTPVR